MGTKERIEREKEQRRERIIRAAEKLFLKKGLAATTMDEIAHKCELSKGALYLYFNGKVPLYHAVVHRAMTAMFEIMKRSQEGVAPPLERIRRIGEAYYSFYESHPDKFRILDRIQEHDAPGAEVDDEALKIRDMHNRVWGLIMDIIRDGIRDGAFREDTDPSEVAISLYAMSSMIIRIMDQYRRMSEGMAAAHESIFGGVDLRKVLSINGRRIVYSIMKNPPGNPNEAQD